MYVLSSCTNQNEIFNGNIVNLSLEKIRMEPMLGKPYQIATIDSFLIIADNVDGKGLLIYNLVDSSYSRKFDIGQGPNDIIPPIDLDTYADEIVMLQRRTGVCKNYNIYDLVNDINANCLKVVLENSDRCCKVDEGFVYMGYSENGIFSFINLNDSTMNIVDSFDELSNKDAVAKYKLLQGNLAYSFEGKRLIYAPFFASYIKCYSYIDRKWCLEKSYQLGGNVIENRLVDKAEVDLFETDKRFCLDVCTDGNCFYILYDGMEMGETEKPQYRYILRFNNEGKYDCMYRVDSSVSNICVSKEGILYALMINDEDGEFVVAKSPL